MELKFRVRCNCGEDPIVTDTTINHVKGEITFHVHDHDCKDFLSELVDKGKRVKMTVEKCQCPAGPHRARGRSIDVPIIEDSLTLKAVKVIHCPTCEVNYVRDEYLDQLEREFTRAGIPTNRAFLWGMICKGLDYWEQKFGTKYKAKKESEHGGESGGEEGDDDN